MSDCYGQADEVSEYFFTLSARRRFGTLPANAFMEITPDARLKARRLHFHSMRYTFANRLVQSWGLCIEVFNLPLEHKDNSGNFHLQGE